MAEDTGKKVVKKSTWIFCALLLALASYGQDTVTFKTGRTIACDIQSFADGIFSISFEGKVRFAPAENIQSIQFAQPESPAKTQAPEVTPTPQPSRPTPVAKEKEKQEGPIFEPGIQIRVGGYDSKVSTEDHADLRELKKNGMKYATVNIQVINNTSETIGVSWGTFKLKTQDGTICEPTVWVPRIGRMDWTYVRPRDKVKGKIGFIVPIDIDMPCSFVRYDIIPTIGHPDSPQMYSEWASIR